MDADIPEVGDVGGLTRLYWQAVRGIRAKDIPEADRQDWLALVETRYRAARAAARGFPATA